MFLKFLLEEDVALFEWTNCYKLDDENSANAVDVDENDMQKYLPAVEVEKEQQQQEEDEQEEEERQQHQPPSSHKGPTIITTNSKINLSKETIKFFAPTIQNFPPLADAFWFSNMQNPTAKKAGSATLVLYQMNSTAGTHVTQVSTAKLFFECLGNIFFNSSGEGDNNYNNDNKMIFEVNNDGSVEMYFGDEKYYDLKIVIIYFTAIPNFKHQEIKLNDKDQVENKKYQAMWGKIDQYAVDVGHKRK